MRGVFLCVMFCLRLYCVRFVVTCIWKLVCQVVIFSCGMVCWWASDLRVWGCVYLLFVWPGVLNSVGLHISFGLFLFGCWVVW